MKEIRPFLMSVTDPSMEISKEDPLQWLKTFLEFLSEKISEPLHLLKSFADALQKMKEIRPFLKSFTDSSMEISKEDPLQWLKTFLEFLSEKISEPLHLLKSFADSSMKITKEKVLPWLKNSGELLFEKIKEHPFLFGLVVLIAVLLLWCCCSKGGGPMKMMKAPGRDYRMPRSIFEANPRGYFRDLRGKQ